MVLLARGTSDLIEWTDRVEFDLEFAVEFVLGRGGVVERRWLWLVGGLVATRAVEWGSSCAWFFRMGGVDGGREQGASRGRSGGRFGIRPGRSIGRGSPCT